MQGKKGIWLKVPLGRSELVPIAVKVQSSEVIIILFFEMNCRKQAPNGMHV